jgi:hypothetical protein
MHNYVCFYDRQRTEVSASSSLNARDIALLIFQRDNPRRKIKPYAVTVVLADKPIDPASL